MRVLAIVKRQHSPLKIKPWPSFVVLLYNVGCISQSNVSQECRGNTLRILDTFKNTTTCKQQRFSIFSRLHYVCKMPELITLRLTLIWLNTNSFGQNEFIYRYLLFVTFPQKQCRYMEIPTNLFIPSSFYFTPSSIVIYLKILLYT